MKPKVFKKILDGDWQLLNEVPSTYGEIQLRTQEDSTFEVRDGLDGEPELIDGGQLADWYRRPIETKDPFQGILYVKGSAGHTLRGEVMLYDFQEV